MLTPWDIKLNGACKALYKLNDNAADSVITDSVGSKNGVSTNYINQLWTQTASVVGKINRAFNCEGGLSPLYHKYHVVFNEGLDVIWGLSTSSVVTFFGWVNPATYVNASIIIAQVMHSLSFQGTVSVYLDTSGHLIANNTSQYIYPAGFSYRRATTTAVIPTDSWTFFTATIYPDTRTPKIWLNGALADISATSSGNPAQLYIGKWATFGSTQAIPPNDKYLNAKIDLFGVCDRELTQVEITGLYNTGLGTENTNGGVCGMPSILMGR
jgi:hypothetical protein